MSDTRTDPAPAETLPEEMQDHALEPVPLSRRKPLIQMIIVQIGWNISVSSFLVGGIIGGGTSLGEGLAAILLGNLVLVAVSTLVGLIGFRTGLTSYLLSRVVFGRYGSIVVSLLLGVLAMGFIGILMDTWGAAVHKLVPAIPSAAFVLAFAVAITLTAIFGFKGLARFSAVAVPIEIAIAVFALVRIGQSAGGFGDLPDYTPKAAIGFSVALGAVVSTWVTGAALVGDVARYAIRARDVLISCFFGFVVGAGIFETIATLSAMKVGNPNFVVVMQGLGLLAPAVVMLVLALWNTADNNLYSSSLAFTNASSMVGLRIRKPVWVIVAIVIATLVAFAGFADRFLSFLNIVGLVAPPFAGVVIAHFWLLGALRRTGAQLTANLPALRPEALLAWAVAAAAAKYTKTLGTDAVEGLVYGLVLYAVLGGLVLLVTRSRGRESGAPAVRAARPGREVGA
ncbi:MAG: purine-cytosine permease family protein [Mycobacteriales bacterium]